MSTFNNYCGYLKGFPEWQAQRIKGSLDEKVKWIDSDGKYKITTEIDYMTYMVLKKGWYPDSEQIMHSEHKEYNKPITIFYITNGKKYGKINKPIYDYIVWLKKNFKTYEKALFADICEGERQKQIRETEISNENDRKKMKADAAEYKRWVHRESKKYLWSYINNVTRDLLRKYYGEEKYKSIKVTHYLSIYVLLQNIDDPVAKYVLKEKTYSDYAAILLLGKFIKRKIPRVREKRYRLIDELSVGNFELLKNKKPKKSELEEINNDKKK